MGNCIRILGTLDPDIHINDLVESLTAAGISAGIDFDLSESPSQWTILEISNENGELLAQLEREPVSEQSEGEKEIRYLKEIIDGRKPASAVKWLIKYFENVKVVYTFRLLDIAYDEENLEIIAIIKNCIWEKAGGILQADNEGFTNEEGYYILWQFPDEVSGECNCAIESKPGVWETFKIDLDDAIQRQEFKSGEVPRNSEPI